jgi:hypothetical protein
VSSSAALPANRTGVPSLASSAPPHKPTIRWAKAAHKYTEKAKSQQKKADLLLKISIVASIVLLGIKAFSYTQSLISPEIMTLALFSNFVVLMMNKELLNEQTQEQEEMALYNFRTATGVHQFRDVILKAPTLVGVHIPFAAVECKVLSRMNYEILIELRDQYAALKQPVGLYNHEAKDNEASQKKLNELTRNWIRFRDKLEQELPNPSLL